MTRTHVATVAVLSLAAGVGSFFGARSLASSQPATATGLSTSAATQPASAGSDATALPLGLSLEQAKAVLAADPGFGVEAAALRAALEKERGALAALLEAPGADDERILEHVERVISAHDAMERRVARHVLAIRRHLSPSQAKQLMDLTADEVRGAGMRWRHGQTAEPNDRRGSRGQGGRGAGGPGYRGGR